MKDNSLEDPLRDLLPLQLVLDQARRFGRMVRVLPHGYVKIEGEQAMTINEALMWIERQATVQCRHCGRYKSSNNYQCGG